MPHVTLTDEQARIITEATGPVEARDHQGRTIARVTPLDPADVDAVARSKAVLARRGTPIPSEQVQAHLRKLEEISQREPLDESKALELLRRMRAGETV